MPNAAAFGIGCNNLLGRNDSFCSHPIEDLGRFVPSVLYIFIKPSQLLPQYMLHTFPGPVAMILKGQQHQPGSPSRTAYGLKENFGLKREGTWVRVIVAMNDQDWFVNLVGEKGGRYLNINISRVEEGTTLGLKAKRLSGLVVRSATRDASPKQVAVRKEVGHHKPAVAVADDAYPFGIGHSHLNCFGDRRLRVSYQLGYKSVIGGFRITEHRHGSPVEHCIALE